jgi:hypothetical protein
MLISKKTWCFIKTCRGTLSRRKTAYGWQDKCSHCPAHKLTSSETGFCMYIMPNGEVKYLKA